MHHFRTPPGGQKKSNLFGSVADLGGAVGGNCPLQDENSAWRPIFGKKGSPYPYPNALYFVFCSECGKHIN